MVDGWFFFGGRMDKGEWGGAMVGSENFSAKWSAKSKNMPRSKDTAAAFKHFYADAVIFYSCHFAGDTSLKKN